MMGFMPDDRGLVTRVDAVEISLLTSLVGQVNELLGGADAAEGADPFALWEESFGGGGTLDHDDPIIARLFPDAYPDDPVATAEHHRFTEDDQRRSRVHDGTVVLEDLEQTDGGASDLVVPLAHVGAWLKTLNGVRVALAVRLGIESEADHEVLEGLSVRDPRAQVVAIYDWLAMVLESLLAALDSGNP